MEPENVHVKWAHGPRPTQKLLDRAREIIRLKHYSIRTERAYLNWMRRYILFHHKRHPKEMGPAEIEAFLTHLALAGNVARSTQHQAFNALLFLDPEVLGISLDDAGINAMRAHKKGTLPVVLTKDEVQRVIVATTGVYQLIAKLLYGSGLRLIEGLRLRVQDVDFSLQEVSVRDGKGERIALRCCLKRSIRSCATIWSVSGCFTSKTSPPAMGGCTCRMHWHANTPMPIENGVGSMCFRHTGLARPAIRRHPTPSHPREGGPAAVHMPSGTPGEARDAAHVPPQFRHAFADGRV